ncbi:MAG: DUF2339 domain-containing protein [Pyrinomonadaceae bacterium]|nr:DUF2339 domain-containing protein [Pyrinomonadaceae bacterium]
MTEDREQIERLQTQLDRLVRTQIDFQKEVTAIRAELERLRSGKSTEPISSIPPPVSVPEPTQPTPPPSSYQPPREVTPPAFTQVGDSRRSEGSQREQSAFSRQVSSYSDSARTDLEKFIGENLISKIGIVILILGVGIGAKFAIDNGWISPLIRIVFGYAIGMALVAIAVRLKAKYHEFSAVLLSGGMAAMYFVTYFAYAYYSLMSQSVAFVLMAIFTIFTVAAALIYKRQVIAHIGLVGAYAVPFLLSDRSGNYLFLFAYMAIINVGILAISIRRYWKPLFYTSSIFTWVIFSGWFANNYVVDKHFGLALTFLAIFFATFFAARIVHAVTHNERELAESGITTIGTAVVFYVLCLGIGGTTVDLPQYTVLFIYLAAASLTILIASFRFFGAMMVYVCYPFTWLIFAAWFNARYNAEQHFVFAAIFASVFFAIFYVTTLIYRLVSDSIGRSETIGLMMTNSFVFYGFGYAILDSRENLRQYEGLFTVAHAFFHSAVSQAVSRIKPQAVDVVQVLVVLVVTFATIAVPIQFDGNVVTIVFAVEAAVLFVFGRLRGIDLFEYLSFPVLALATGSLLTDWAMIYDDRFSHVVENMRLPLRNGDFVAAMVYVAALSFIFVVNRDKKYEAAIDDGVSVAFGRVVAAVGVFVLYNMFRLEIGNYWHLLIAGAGIESNFSALVEWTLVSKYDLPRFNVVWQIIYTMFFLIALCGVNLRKLRSATLALVGVILSIATLAIFVTFGMYLFYELRFSFMAEPQNDGHVVGPMNIAIRYISYLFAATILYSLYLYRNSTLLVDRIDAKVLELGYDAIFYGTVFITISCELVNAMVQLRLPDEDKLGLSILWGVYALAMIVIGIAWSKKHLRIAAIVLLAITLAKLFLYDVADLPTIPKTILFISLGVLLLLVSFLYNKFKSKIFNEPPTSESENI